MRYIRAEEISHHMSMNFLWKMILNLRINMEMI